MPGGRCAALAARAAPRARLVPSGGAQGVQRRRHLLEGAARLRRGLRDGRIRPRGPLPRSGLRRAVDHQRLPAVGLERTAPAGVEISLPRCLPSPSDDARQARPRGDPLRRLEHRAPADRPAELARQPEELRLPSRRARVALARVRRAWLRRRVPPRRRAAGPVHVVVEPRAGLGEERGVADRLPDRDAEDCRDGARGIDLPEPPLLRSRAADGRLRLRAPAATRRGTAGDGRRARAREGRRGGSR